MRSLLSYFRLMLPLNLQFCLDTVQRFTSNGRILDFGCGDGAAVQEGLNRGLDIYGSELFYGGGSHKGTVDKSGLLGTRIREMQPTEIPFPDNHFDFIY